jgi:dihydropteroate synthase
MAVRPQFNWQLRSRRLALGERTLVMGILNVTPDSFSDGGRFLDPHAAINRALSLLDEGADIVDVGGESTRPGKKERVSQEQEIDRVLPVIEGIRKVRPDAIVSVDTYRSGTATAALEAGAEIINDVSALRWDTAMSLVAMEQRPGLVMMHMRGEPEEWRHLPKIPADELLLLVKSQLADWADDALAAGINRDQMVLDPGFGFGKNFDENYPLLGRLHELHALGYPILSGPSRKSFIGRTLAKHGTNAPVGERLHGTLATVVASVLQGAHIVRVHDVQAAVQACRVADEILNASVSG